MYLANGLTEAEIAAVLEAAKKALAVGGMESRFDHDGNPTVAGMYEVWPSADKTHYIVSYS